MLAVFHLLPVPEIIVQQKSAMTELLTQRAQGDKAVKYVHVPGSMHLRRQIERSE